ncbi:MAG: hypothetical protein JKY02_08325 [Flavobacteriaceae bacterium]|nr:hypothetical protein [Flavobacteriaceae bacterium]
MATANSHEDIVSLAKGEVLFQGEYTFYTPGSINAASGNFSLLISTNSDGSTTASGEMNIQTLWGLTTKTTLHYQGKADFNSSTGYTTVKGEGHGVMIYDFNKKRTIKASILIILKPGLKNGKLTVEGFGQEMPCTVSSIIESNI